MLHAWRALLPQAQPHVHAASELDGPLFDRIVYINLERSVSRRICMEQYMEEANLQTQAERWNATDGSRFELGQLMSRAAELQGGAPEERNDTRWLRGTMACRSSHLDVLNELLRSGKTGERYLVLEDDVSLPLSFQTTARGVLKTAPEGWDVLKLGCFDVDSTVLDSAYYDVVENTSAPFPVIRTFNATDSETAACHERETQPGAPHCYVCGGNHAVIYRHESLAKLLAGLANHIHIDCAMSMARDPSLQVYCVQVSTVRQWTTQNQSVRSGDAEQGSDCGVPERSLDTPLPTCWWEMNTTSTPHQWRCVNGGVECKETDCGSAMPGRLR